MTAAQATRYYGAPAAVLLAATVAVLLVRSALPHPAVTPARTPTVAAVHPAEPAHPKHRAAIREYATVQRGDTFGAIAARAHTTVAALEKLNPGVAPTALRVGQKIRVK